VDVLDAQFIASANELSRLPPPAFAEVAFAGRSNVGKSSLINSLARRLKLVRTSNTPGCTRGINVFRMTLRDAVIDFVDLPGYGFARRSKSERASWGPLIEGFLRDRPGLRGVVLIVDVRRGLEPDDQQLLEFLDHIGRPAWIVATKTDKLSASQRKTAVAKLAKTTGHKVFGYSSTTHEGRDAVFGQVLRACRVTVATPAAAV
jgi:GTP-binding protein